MIFKRRYYDIQGKVVAQNRRECLKYHLTGHVKLYKISPLRLFQGGCYLLLNANLNKSNESIKIFIINLQKILLGNEYVPPLKVLHCHNHADRDPLQHKYQTCKTFAMHSKVFLILVYSAPNGKEKEFAKSRLR